jgi:hypothetical protein
LADIRATVQGSRGWSGDAHCLLEDSLDVAEVAVELRRRERWKLEVCSARRVGCVTLMRMKRIRGESGDGRLGCGCPWQTMEMAVSLEFGGVGGIACDAPFGYAALKRMCVGNHCLLTPSFAALQRFSLQLPCKAMAALRELSASSVD